MAFCLKSDYALKLIQCLRVTNTSNSDTTVERNNKLPAAPRKQPEHPTMRQSPLSSDFHLYIACSKHFKKIKCNGQMPKLRQPLLRSGKDVFCHRQLWELSGSQHRSAHPSSWHRAGKATTAAVLAAEAVPFWNFWKRRSLYFSCTAIWSSSILNNFSL